MSSKDDAKKEHEKEIVQRFLETDVGKAWVVKNNVVISSMQSHEPLDFIFQSTNGKTIGLELVRFISTTKNGHATQHLKTIGNNGIRRRELLLVH